MTNILPAGARYFAAANTGGGFVSYYGTIFPSDKFDRLVIVKGGSGTGKSSFLRALGRAAEARGATPEYFFCSSDPTSLDGVSFSLGHRRVAALDGTAPHVRDTELPGAVDTIHNIGDYWDTRVLTAGRTEISALCRRRAHGFADVYDYLAASARAAAAGERVVAAHTDHEKLRAAAGRLLRGCSRADGYTELLRPLDSFGMCGAVRFDTYAELASQIWRVTGAGASVFLAALREQARLLGLAVACSPAFLDPTSLSALFLPDAGMAFTAEEHSFVPAPGEHRVNMERFVRLPGRTARTALRAASKLRAQALENASLAFSGIEEAHFSLEQLYGAAMDFDRKNRDEAALIAELLA